MTATPGPGTPAAAGPRPCRRSPSASIEKDRTDANVRMAVTVEEAPRLGWVVAKALMRFAFMVANNLVAIPSYICYVIILQPLRVLDSKRFWIQIMHKEGLYMDLAGLELIDPPASGSGLKVMEWGEDIKAISNDEAMMLVNHQATGDVCTLMMCLQDKGPVVAQMMWLMDHIFKYTNFGIVSLIHGDFFIRQSALFHVIFRLLPCLVLELYLAKSRHLLYGLQTASIDILSEKPSVLADFIWFSFSHKATLLRIFPIKDVPLETDDLASWLYQRFIEKEDLLSHFYKT
ncbi:hypothetical protein STEG23_003955, partial [Scotinomys teguina]